MSEMLTNIKRVVQEDISNRVTQQHALHEAIINALHANATHVICRLTGEQDVLADDTGEIAPKRVVGIEVEDNGDGFTDANYASFGRYRTDFKMNLGCKGVGRFIFLKLFERVQYTSYLAKEGEKRHFPFTMDFESSDIQREAATVDENKTTLTLAEVTSKYFSRDLHIDRRMRLCLADIREEALNHLIPTLFFAKKQQRDVTIEFIDTLASKNVAICSDDIPDFKTVKFSVTDHNQQAVDFEIHHAISAGGGSIQAYHCANRRTVCTFAEKGFRPQGFAGHLLLESAFLDEHVNNERNDFDIYPVRTDTFLPISWDLINTQLKASISVLVHEQIPDVDNTNIATIKDIQEQRPYLMEYIAEDDLRIAGFVDKGQIIEKAKKRFDEAKEQLIRDSGKDNYSDEDLEDAIRIARSELVSYIQDRVLVVQRLKTMLSKNESSEKLIHNLFMERYTDDDNCDVFSSRKNNLWLLDDRFTGYSYAASEKRIKDLLNASGTGIDDDRPDLALFFSQDPVDKKGLKAVLVELKPFGKDAKSDRDKFAGIQQLLDYIQAFQTSEQIEEVWAFLVTDVDDKLASRLVTNGFTPLFSLERPIYHQYYKSISASIYVVGATGLILDAEARNKVFIDIINKNTRLSRYLNPASNKDIAEKAK